jgi:hypothetical protein
MAGRRRAAPALVSPWSSRRSTPGRAGRGRPTGTACVPSRARQENEAGLGGVRDREGLLAMPESSPALPGNPREKKATPMSAAHRARASADPPTGGRAPWGRSFSCQRTRGSLANGASARARLTETDILRAQRAVVRRRRKCAASNGNAPRTTAHRPETMEMRCVQRKCARYDGPSHREDGDAPRTTGRLIETMDMRGVRRTCAA